METEWAENIWKKRGFFSAPNAGIELKKWGNVAVQGTSLYPCGHCYWHIWKGARWNLDAKIRAPVVRIWCKIDEYRATLSAEFWALNVELDAISVEFWALAVRAGQNLMQGNNFFAPFLCLLMSLGIRTIAIWQVLDCGCWYLIVGVGTWLLVLVLDYAGPVPCPLICCDFG